MNSLDKNIDNIIEEEDFGCIVGCALTDTLQDIIASLAGGYAILHVKERTGKNPDKAKLSMLEKRQEEIVALKYFFAVADKSYNDIRRWIDMYSEELKYLNSLRKQYESRV
jgi:hypothetical protein